MGINSISYQQAPPLVNSMAISTGNGGFVDLDIYSLLPSSLYNSWLSNTSYDYLSEGDTFGVIYSIDIDGGLIGLSVPEGYVSNDDLPDGTATFNHTLSDLGMIPGSYTAAVINGDNIEINIVPERNSIWIAVISIVGLVGIMGHRRRRRS